MKFVNAAAFVLAIALMFQTNSMAALVISGVVDGNEPGGIPKGIELVATSDITDLSAFSIGRYTNGGASLTAVTELPNAPLNAGEFFYITGTSASDQFFTDAGFTIGLSSQTVANINGDDLLQLVSSSDNAVAFDTFGQVGQGDTNFYANSFAYRSNASQTGDVDGSVDAADNFVITDWDQAQWSTTFGSFQVQTVPEPTSVLILSGLCGTLAYRRRRN